MSISQEKKPLTIDSINEVLDSIANWKGSIDNGIKYKRIKEQDIPAALLTWFKRVIQMIRRCMTDKQFEEVLAASSLELSEDFLE